MYLISCLQFVIVAILEDYPHSSQLWIARAQAVHQAGPVHVPPGHPASSQTWDYLRTLSVLLDVADARTLGPDQRDSLTDLPNVLTYATFVETEKAGYLIRQYAGASLYDRIRSVIALLIAFCPSCIDDLLEYLAL